MPLLEVENLHVSFETHHGRVRAVDGVSFSLEPGETVGLVGESGSGKSVTSLAILGMVPSPPGMVNAVGVRFQGRDLLELPESELRRIRGNRISMVFQDPMTSLNPLLTVGRQMSEVLEVHRGTDRRSAQAVCARALGDVGIANPELRLDAYPHQLSGGMRQRVMIAMALLLEPKVLLADEPTTALDVTIQAQILDLMRSLQERHGTAIVLVTHALGVVAGIADRVLVMYAGRIVEEGATEALFRAPLHLYTRGLLRSVPALDRDPGEALYSIRGQPPDLAELPPGCAFEPRCEHAVARCQTATPELETYPARKAPGGRRAACFEMRRIAGGAS